jgi:SAM-dependent methyltransferase
MIKKKAGLMFDAMMRYLTRKNTTVSFNDLERNKPISAAYGVDRGTPIDRYYIEAFLQRNVHLIKGRILEVGDSYYSRRFTGGKAESFEVLHATPENKTATLIGDLTDTATLPKNSFDCFICTQTYNFIFDVGKAVEGTHYLLKPGGVLLATVSGISQISRYDMERWGDYWRFTTASVEKLFTPVFKGRVAIENFGNVLAATAFLQGVSVEDLPDRALLDDNDPDYQLLITIVARKEP